MTCEKENLIYLSGPPRVKSAALCRRVQYYTYVLKKEGGMERRKGHKRKRKKF